MQIRKEVICETKRRGRQNLAPYLVPYCVSVRYLGPAKNGAGEI